MKTNLTTPFSAGLEGLNYDFSTLVLLKCWAYICFLLLRNKWQVRQLKNNTRLLTCNSVVKAQYSMLGFSALAWAGFSSGGSPSVSKLIPVTGRIQFLVVVRLTTLLSCWMLARKCSQLWEAAARSLPTGPWISAKRRTSPVSDFPLVILRRKSSAFKGRVISILDYLPISKSAMLYNITGMKSHHIHSSGYIYRDGITNLKGHLRTLPTAGWDNPLLWILFCALWNIYQELWLLPTR